MEHRIRKTWLRALAAVAAGMLLATACGGGGDSAQPADGSGQGDSPASEQAGGSDATLVVDKSFDLKTADPGRQFEVTGSIVGRALYDTLLTFADADVSQPVPSVAESFEVNDDATEFTFTLRDDVVFSDGSPLEADDVVFSLNRVKNLKGNPSFLLEGVEVSSPDPQTVVLTTAEPNTALPAILPNPSLGILNAEVVEAEGGTDAADADATDEAEAFLNETSAGSGPYVLESFSTTSETVLVANPEYWGDPPAYGRVVLRNVDGPTQRLNVQSGESQIALDLSGDQIEGLSGDVEVLTTPSPNIWFLFANADEAVSEVTSNPDFREAVRYGLDYEGILELVGEGGIQAPGVIPNVLLGALDEGSGVTRDVDRATAALERSGIADPTVALEYPSDFSANGLNFGPVAERIKANLEEVGITVNLTPAPIATALETYRAGKEEMGLWLWAPDYPDPADYLVFTPGELVGLRAGWQEGAAPEIEELADQAGTTIDNAEREGLYRRLQELLNESGPFFPLFQPTAAIVSAPSVGNVAFHPAWTIELSALQPQ